MPEVRSERYRGQARVVGNVPRVHELRQEDLAQERRQTRAGKNGESCPECIERNDGEGIGELLIRSSRYGKFIACTRYPKCKYTRQCRPESSVRSARWAISERRGGKGKRKFWGCSRYPECDFISNDKPVNKPCPVCRNNWLATKWTRDRGEFLKCPNCKREFTDEMNEIVSEEKV